ncbi:MAG: double-strand break repair helicase AddA, partial [Pseudomonadota bacterium]|nr:double-strand break repair helicase AddA [Pseudomonadota bacterium]
MSSAVFPLAGNQAGAVDPSDNVWLSASAGTGKTQVLSARVLRLLLRRDVHPGEILCLTFTKAGAAEMANRINAVLARWVRLDGEKLKIELGYLGADADAETVDRARTLFASVLDCPGGGLRIDTIHAFSQWLLANFPEEAGLTPGSRPMEDRERDALALDVLSDLLSEADTQNDTRILDAVHLFTTRKDPEALKSWLLRCAGRDDLWTGPKGWQSPLDARVRQLLDMPADADEHWAFEGLHPDVFPDDTLRSMVPAFEEWATKTASNCIDFIVEWLSLNHAARVDRYTGFCKTLLKADGQPNLKMKTLRENSPGFEAGQDLISEAVLMVEERKALLDLAKLLTAALELGRAFALKWSEAKRLEGLLDFDDLIQRAATLLGKTEASDWIRYKLDRQFDHILIDEAQDTNAAQWDIVEALIDDFFSGEGASGDKLRTVFTVGDYKQAIFGFQGTSPENYERAKIRIAKRIDAAKLHAAEMRDNRHIPNMEELDLERSFRTSQWVLSFVNKVIGELGHEAFGLPAAPRDHAGDPNRAGLVTMWEPVRAQADDADEDESEDDRDWIAKHETVLAERIAQQVEQWVRGKDRFVLEKGQRRHATPGDIMVLVRKRGDLAGEIVAKLHARRIAVAGVDRLRLGNPLVVKDVMAALRFAAQPLDDLQCANLLSSPLIGWSQDDLLAYVPRKKNMPLWHHLRRADAPPSVMQTAEKLRELLRLADFETPQSLIAWLLTGPWEGRKRLIERLGQEANDPLDELVNSAFAYENGNTASLTGFIDWFDASSAELKRDPDGVGGQVRVMTVHGSKGLQAPIVILADATGKPGKGSALELPEVAAGEATGLSVPLPGLSSDERVGRVRDADEAVGVSDLQEHWRLLYVAMTRAEEALFIGGSLGKQQLKKGPDENSWYARIAPVFDSDGLADPIWGGRHEWGERAEPLVLDDAAPDEADPKPEIPAWAVTPIGPEPKPPRPLAPSSAGEEQGADPPSAGESDSAAMRLAMQRGVLIHRLLERLPDLPPHERAEAGAMWLGRQAAEMPEAVRARMLDQAIAVLAEPDFAEIFSPQALAEVPLSATVEGVVVAGTVDRLLVTDDVVTVVDFKTTRRPPMSSEEVPPATLKQMAAYVAALEIIYP